MILSTKLFKKDSDMSIVNDFAQERNLATIDKDLLSDYGIIVLADDIPVVCGWLYPTVGSKLCVIENVIRSKKINDKDVIDESMKLLFVTIHLIAKDMGYKYIKNSVENNSMKSRLESYGYVSLNDNVTNYMGVL